jgi:hypothetical protein
VTDSVSMASLVGSDRVRSTCSLVATRKPLKSCARQVLRESEGELC